MEFEKKTYNALLTLGYLLIIASTIFMFIAIYKCFNFSGEVYLNKDMNIQLHLPFMGFILLSVISYKIGEKLIEFSDKQTELLKEEKK